MPQHRIPMTNATGHSVLLGLFMWAEPAVASWYGPDPFRRERVEGRDFEYDAESFLHRFSYEPMPLLTPAQRLPRDGVFGTGGSTRSNELYVRQQVQLSLPTDTRTYLGYRFFRFEDFDGRYDQQWLGTGYQADGWALLFWGDVTGSKQDSDLQVEWQLHDTPDRRLRLMLVAPDALFNSKTDGEDEYQDQPLTWYGEGRFRLADEYDLYGFINWNQPTAFYSADMNVDVDDEQLSGGIGLATTLAAWEWRAEAEGLTGERTRAGLSPDNINEQALKRDSAMLTLEASRRVDNGNLVWLGLRYFQFDESDRRPLDAEHWLDQSRREIYLYAGHEWHINADLLFRPSLIGGHINNQERYPLNPKDNEDDTGFIGKLSPAFVFLLGRERQGSVTLNPTLYLHELGFGGGNVQLQFPL